MLSKDRLLDILKIRFDYYAAQAVFSDVLSSLGLKEATELGAAEVERVAAFLLEKVPGSSPVVEKLKALLSAATVPEAAQTPVNQEAEARDKAESPSPEAEPTSEASAEEAPAPKKKGKK